jgi:hypothetical protein
VKSTNGTSGTTSPSAPLNLSTPTRSEVVSPSVTGTFLYTEAGKRNEGLPKRSEGLCVLAGWGVKKSGEKAAGEEFNNSMTVPLSETKDKKVPTVDYDVLSLEVAI